MNEVAETRLRRGIPKSLYFGLGNYLANQQRGQSPYTPAISLMLQLHRRLLDIQDQTLPALVLEHQERAESFRAVLADPELSAFRVLPARSSNAMTAIWCDGVDAEEVVEELRIHHDIVVAPSGGTLKSHVIRIAHMGAQKDADVAILISALRGISSRAAHSLIERVEA